MNEQARQLYIPNEITALPDLNISEMRVLATIKALDNERNCFATNSYFAECLNLSSRQITNIIKSLSKKGYIQVENGNSFRRRIKYIGQALSKNENVVSIEERKQKETSKKALPGNKFETVPKKVQAFNAIDERNWDFNEIERLEREYIDRKIREEIN